MATTRRSPRKRTTTTTKRKPKASVMTDITNIADDTKDYVVDHTKLARDYIAKHPALAVAAGAALVAVGWSARRLWLPAVAVAAAERLLPNHIELPDMRAVMGQLRSFKPSFMG